MNKRMRIALLVFVVAVFAIVFGSLWLFRDRPPEELLSLTPPLLIQSQYLDQFARATEPEPFEFPRDHGPHPNYQTEWWYYTGNLQSESGDRFGYQLTFFRRALEPPEFLPDRDSEWAADQLYLAHLAITDVEGSQFYAYERTSRGALGLAGSQATPYRVWLENWEVRTTAEGAYQLRAQQEDLELVLTLNETKGPIFQGNQGYSQKGPQPGNASYYYSLPRLETSGSLEIANSSFAVTGTSWMDHEFSTSALGPNQVGWDWFSIQLNNGSELMLFQLRHVDASVSAYSSGTLISPDGKTTSLTESDFHIEVLDTWQSPHSGAAYPAEWRISVPAKQLELNVVPQMSDQELNVSFVYWEGSVRVSGAYSEQPVAGYGYVELTGYAHSMQGQF